MGIHETRMQKEGSLAAQEGCSEGSKHKGQRARKVRYGFFTFQLNKICPRHTSSRSKGRFNTQAVMSEWYPSIYDGYFL